MISIIICSRHPDISASLRENMEETIGVEFEIVTIDNSHGKYSISSAYNRGVERSLYPFSIRTRASGSSPDLSETEISA